jgi:hypothetical protein
VLFFIGRAEPQVTETPEFEPGAVQASGTAYASALMCDSQFIKGSICGCRLRCLDYSCPEANLQLIIEIIPYTG